MSRNFINDNFILHSHMDSATKMDYASRRSSIGSTTNVLRSPPQSLRQGSPSNQLLEVAFTASSPRRLSPTPLADRFMSPNYKTLITIPEDKKEEEKTTKIIAAEEKELNNVPNSIGSSQGNDTLFFLSPPPALLLTCDDLAYDLRLENPSNSGRATRSNYPGKKRRSNHHYCCSKKKREGNTNYSRSHHTRLYNDMWWQEKKRGSQQQIVKSNNNKRKSGYSTNIVYNLQPPQPIKSRTPALIIEFNENQHSPSLPIEKKWNKADDEKNCKKQRKRKISSLFCCFIQRWQDDNNNRLPLTRSNQHQKRGRRRCFFFCGRREWVILTFICLILSIVLALVFWPRIPLIRVEGAKLTSAAKVTQTRQYVNNNNTIMGNVAFETSWLLNITMDNRNNILNTRFDKIQIIAKDAMTGLLIGKSLEQEKNGNIIWLAGQTISTIQLPIAINYQARDRTDATFSNLLRSCTNNNSTIMMEGREENGQHSALSVQFWFTLYLFGLDWFGHKASVIATPATGGFFCPH